MTLFGTYPEFKEYAFKFKDIEPGTIIYVDNKKGIYVRTIDGIILIIELQLENSRKMLTVDFLRGNKVDIIDRFE